MSEIYYSKRTGIATDNLLSRGSGLSVNNTAGNTFLRNFKIGDNIYKPKDSITRFIYLHNVEIYFNESNREDGSIYTLTLLNSKSSPYTQGQEARFFNDFGSMVFLPSLSVYGGLKSVNFAHTGHPTSNDVNGVLLYENNGAILNTFAHCRINTDTISILQVR